jgi:trafficking protein particle complex subunit 4
MTVYHVFIINRAGSLIYDWENRRFIDPQIAPLSADKKIVLASVFHAMYTMASQLSPVAKSSGVEVLETSQFRFVDFIDSKNVVKLFVFYLFCLSYIFISQ